MNLATIFGMDRRVAVWMAPEQVGLIREVAQAAELSIVAAGCWGRGLSPTVAVELEAKPIDDLRAALASLEVDLFLIAAAGSFGVGAASEDSAAVLGAHARDVKVATLEPIPAAALDLTGGGWLDGAIRPVDVLRFVPRSRLSSSFRDAAEVIESFGTVRSMSIEAWCSPAEGSLGARLYASLELILALMGEPETIDAACAMPRVGASLHALPGETLRDLHGDMTANLRFSDGRVAGLIASDQAGRWNRSVTLVGDSGRLRIVDDGFEWIGSDGTTLDQSKPRARRGKDAPSLAAIALADSLNRLLDPAIPDPGPTNHAAILAISQAALLSARTGQGESPATIRRMVGVE